MTIKSVGQFQDVLKNYGANDWAKKSNLKVNSELTMNDAPNSILENSGQRSFGDFLMDSVSQVNKLQEDANIAIEKLATGKSKNIHETLLAVEEAELAFKTMNQVRTKVIDAYKEIMKMQM